MKSIQTCLAVMISVIMNIFLVNGTKCLPNGCYYDLSMNTTKKIHCKPDGSLEILSYHGNQGCKDEAHYLTYTSPIENECCDLPRRVFCTYNRQCGNGEYCNRGLCEELPCDSTHCFEDGNDCANVNGCGYCDVQTGDGGVGLCIPALSRRKICVSNDGCNNDQYCDNGVCEDLPCNRTPCTEDGGECANVNRCPYCDIEPESGGAGLCIPLGQSGCGKADPEVATYSVTVINHSGATIPSVMGLFETNPNDGPGFPVIFANQSISPGAEGHFQWSLNWGVSWSSGGSGCIPLSGGITYSRTGSIVDVYPNDNTKNNGGLIKYIGAFPSGTWQIFPQPNPDLSDGQIQIKTDASFTNAEAEQDCFTVSITQDGEVIYAQDGAPSEYYKHYIHPTYYLSTVLTDKTKTVSTTVLNEAYEINFGVDTATTICLNDKNQFVPGSTC